MSDPYRQEWMAIAWDEGRNAVSVHGVTDELTGDQIWELRAPQNPYRAPSLAERRGDEGSIRIENNSNRDVTVQVYQPGVAVRAAEDLKAGEVIAVAAHITSGTTDHAQHVWYDKPLRDQTAGDLGLCGE